MMRRMGRPREEGNKDLPPGLHVDRDGYYYISLRVPDLSNPTKKKQETAYLGTKDRERAKKLYWAQRATWDEELLKLQAKQIADRLKAIGRPAGKRTFVNYCEYYRTKKLPSARTRSGKSLAPHTREDYRRCLEAAETNERFDVPMEAVDDQLLRQYLAQWLDSPAHYNGTMSALSRVFKCAIDEGILRKNPILAIERRATFRREVYVPDSDYSAIAAKLEDWQAHACDLIYFNSHRPGDCLRLTEDNVREELIDGRPSIIVSFTASKNGQAMEIVDAIDGPLAQTLQWFREWKKRQSFIGAKAIRHFVVYPTDSHRRTVGKAVSVGYLSKKFAEAVVDALGEKCKGKYRLSDLRKKGLTDEAKLAGKPTDKGGHKTEQMKRYYVVGELPMRVQNNLREIKRVNQ